MSPTVRARTLLGIVLAVLLLPVLPGLHADRAPDPPWVHAWAEPGSPVPRPLVETVRSLLADQSARVGELTDRARESTDPAETIRIERRIQRVKLETEAAIFRLQLGHFERLGNEEAAAEVRTHLAALDALAERSADRELDIEHDGTR